MFLFVINVTSVTDLVEQVMEPESFHTLITTAENWTMEMLAVEAGIFASKSKARSNGFCGEVPHGIHCFGTKKNRFLVWNPIKNDVIPIANFSHKV